MNQRRASAFTLPEIMIAILLIGLAVLGLIGVRLYAVQASRAAPHKQAASLLAATLMAEAEDLIRRGVPPDEAEEQLNGFPAEGSEFSHTVTIKRDSETDPPNLGLENLVHVDVKITWMEESRKGTYHLHNRFADV